MENRIWLGTLCLWENSEQKWASAPVPPMALCRVGSMSTFRSHYTTTTYNRVLMMQLNHGRFMEDGFLILPGFISTEELHELRLGFDVLVQRTQDQSRKDRTPDQPIGGRWQADAQPRVKVDDVVTEETAYVVEYYLGKPLDVSTELLRAERVGLGALGLMVSAVWDRGATDWHRDYCSNTLAPLGGVQRDLAVNGSPYVQWNIALYDDDLFWVVPGSHKNPDSEEMRRQLLMDNRLELPDSFQVSLKAGDAIVYAAYILHWGSPYTSRMRRVIHMGYYDFDKISSFGHQPHYNMDLAFTRNLSAETRAYFEQQVAWTIECRDLYERIFRTALERDGDAFAKQLAEAHPEESCRLVSVAHICRMAEKIQKLCGSQADQLSPEQRGAAEGGHSEELWSDFKRRFTPSEADELGRRFAVMSARMKGDRDRSDAYYTELHRKLSGSNEDGVPNFDTRSLRTHYHEMPKDFAVVDLVSSW